MLRAFGDTLGLTLGLRQAEIAELLGIDANDIRKVGVACDTIDWDGIEHELMCLAHYLVVQQRDKVAAALADAGGTHGMTGRETAT